MSDDLETLAEKLRTLRAEWGDDVARTAFERQAAALPPDARARLATLVFGAAADLRGASLAAGNVVARDPNQGAVHLSDDARIDGVAVGVNLGTIIYGRAPGEDERRRLAWYLAGLANILYRLPLRGLEERLEHGEGIALPNVYVMLATTNHVGVTEDSTTLAGYSKPVEDFYQSGNRNRSLKEDYDPDRVLPDRAIIAVKDIVYRVRRERKVLGRKLYRALLATEAVQDQSRLVLLGEPGAGKSTFLRHFAWALAQRGLDQIRQAPELIGWADDKRTLPILLSLRKLAGRLPTAGANDATVYAALCDEMRSSYDGQIDDLLSEALHRGTALLLFDGLDEVPLDGRPDVANRAATLRAVRDAARRYPNARVVVTCRTRAFSEDLRAMLGWPMETLAPFTPGQMRHFVAVWYHELADKRHFDTAQAQTFSDNLLAAITDPLRPRLSVMAKNPLLLTMMALVVYNKGTLPRDRPQLYERILDLLLGQWDKVRDGQTLAEHLELPGMTSERLRPLLDQLSYAAHAGVTSADERGRLEEGMVRDALITFFELEHPRRAWNLAQQCLDYIEQRSGLLESDGRGSYVLAHRTLQEHCAGRHLLLDRDALTRVLERRADDYWREPILLGLGVVQQTNPWLIESVLRKLIDREEDEQPKTIERWYRDLILAAEIGADRDWAYLRDLRVDIGPLLRDLRRGLVELLQDKAQPLPVAERVGIGFLLGDLGDPRFPVTIDEWRHELARAQAGDTSGYFCCIEAGAYIIGSRDDDLNATDAEKPQHTVTFDAPFLIARYPIANAQWRTWVDQAGGKPSDLAYNTGFNRSNQPVVAVDWHMCNAFCAWLSGQLGVTARLPTEQEWAAAARGGDARRYLWGDEWQDDRAATQEDWRARGRHYTMPVGCYPAGAAPCGALDMAGNVWEWTASLWHSYPGAQKPFTDDECRVLRGGHYGDSQERVRCEARLRDNPLDGCNFTGFRVVMIRRLAQ